MSIDIEIWAKLVSPILVAIFAAFLKQYLEARPRLIAYLGHASAHPVPSNLPGMTGSTVHTHSIVIRNTGKRAAHNVRIGHAVFPASYQIFPAVDHSVLPGQGGSGEILLPTLVPNEQINVSYLYQQDLFWHQIASYVKSDEGLADQINAIPSKPTSMPVRFMLWSLVFVGASSVVYWILLLSANWARYSS